MRWFLIAALTMVLVIDVWFARDAANEEIGSATRYVAKYQQRPIEGPFIVSARAVILSFSRFSEENEGAITAISTLAMAVFTVVLAWATIGLWKAADQQKTDMRESLRIASESSRAALIQANTLVSSERGYVKMSHHAPGLVLFDKNAGAFQIAMEIKNWGRTPCQVTDLVLFPVVLDSAKRLPEEPIYGRTLDQNPVDAFLVSGESFVYRCFPIFTAGEAMESITNGSKTLYLIGCVDYVDKFGIKRRAGYARRYQIQADPDSDNLVLVTQANYNYDRGRKDGEEVPQ